MKTYDGAVDINEGYLALTLDFKFHAYKNYIIHY